MAAPNRLITVLVIDYVTLMREGIRAILDTEPGIEVVGQAADACEALDLNVEPRVIVTGLLSPELTPGEIIEALRKRFPDAAIFAVTLLDDLAVVQALLVAGANGYLSKMTSRAEFVAAIRAVGRGAQYLDPSIGAALVQMQSADPHRPDGTGALTPKEVEVLKMIALGNTNNATADRLRVSLRTIEAHRSHIQRKLDLHTRADLVRYAIETGILAPLENAPLRAHSPQEVPRPVRVAGDDPTRARDT